MEKTPKDPKDPNARPDRPSDAPPRRRRRKSPSAPSDPAIESTPTDTAAQAEDAAKPAKREEVQADAPSTAADTSDEPTPATASDTPSLAPAVEPEVPTPTRAGGDTPRPATRPKPEPKPESAPAKASGGGAIYVALLALVIAIGAVLFIAWQWQQEQQLREDNANLVGQLEGLRQVMEQRGTSLERRIERGEADLASSREALVAVREQQLEAERRLQQRQPSDWMLAEADYLVRMAGRKVWLEQDSDTALALLRDADHRLQTLGDPDLVPLREALADDIALLSGLPRMDRAGLALGIESLIKRIDRLPLNTVELPEVVAAADNGEPTSNLSDWKENLARSWHALTDDFITVRRRQGAVQPLLAPEQEWYLREHLKGKLMQAQLALYHGHNEAFQQALNTARTWMADYFSLEDSAVEGALTQLDQWAQLDVAQAAPIRFSVADPLERLVSERLRRNGGSQP
ncbi:uroporphyrinogen-III C-methyltransferase [Ferrimonas balearica]|uniref:uroporphyrinogen-III C-methyltransferase n=1 Tax=Ferrimonas balearica TaxID=44012 RepID=UPI001C992E03|nr:uroporphyrinogen-III C-methyltransferase [Ferrimonas balearica]MBY5993335.1 uroporphyrinogen-III C-methyltransferase [Ferrimonas balearica]